MRQAGTQKNHADRSADADMHAALRPDDPTQTELLDRIFRDPAVKQGLRFFGKGERTKVKLRPTDDDKIVRSAIGGSARSRKKWCDRCSSSGFRKRSNTPYAG